MSSCFYSSDNQLVGMSNAIIMLQGLQLLVSLPRSKVIIAGVNTAVCTCFPAISARNAGYAAYAAIDASGALDKIELQTAITRMTQAGVIVADYNAIVVEMLENNADPLAPQVYAAIGLSHFVSMRDIYSTMTTSRTVSQVGVKR
jgi:hypothetical protein